MSTPWTHVVLFAALIVGVFALSAWVMGR